MLTRDQKQPIPDFCRSLDEDVACAHAARRNKKVDGEVKVRADLKLPEL